MDLRANTAVDVLIGPFVDKTDGNTTEDALTLTAAEIKLSKNGQALTLKSDVTSALFDDDGYYNCELDATDTNTEGNLVLIVHQSANALPVRHEYNVLSEAAWDSLYAAKDTGFMDVNVKEFGDDAQSMTDLKDFADAGYDPATNKVQGVVLADTVTTYTGNTKQTGDSFLRIGAAGASLTDLGGMATAMKAEVLAEVNTALDAAISELAQAIPSATPSIRNAVMLMYMALRNQLIVQTSGTDAIQIYNDAGTMIAKKLITDSAGDYTEAKAAAGT